MPNIPLFLYKHAITPEKVSVELLDYNTFLGCLIIVGVFIVSICLIGIFEHIKEKKKFDKKRRK